MIYKKLLEKQEAAFWNSPLDEEERFIEANPEAF